MYRALTSTTPATKIFLSIISSISPISPLLVYRTISPPPPIYEIATPKTYLTINDLYIRYVPLKYVKPSHFMVTRLITTRYIHSTIILSIMTIHNLYRMFEKSVTCVSNEVSASLINRNAANSPSNYSISGYKLNNKALFFNNRKWIPRGLII